MTEETNENYEEPESITKGRDKFESNIEAGDTLLFYRQIPAWIVNVESRWIAPVARVHLGNFRGEEVFSRIMSLGCVINLADDLLRASVSQVKALKKMEGFIVFEPQSKEDYVELIGSMQKVVADLKDLIEQTDIRNSVAESGASSDEDEDL